ncbi:Retrotransposon gag domain-containing 1 [Gossypium australe]|uniref:Retrotransposon gag domain-containing 1 n=1 Tax=Gossypium australe TaxID=47621 RepID=A0A5B6WV42_9ROSI|nr:Retrotransposon gag domain-containing 1 [Gossypium australe]
MKWSLVTQERDSGVSHFSPRPRSHEISPLDQLLLLGFQVEARNDHGVADVIQVSAEHMRMLVSIVVPKTTL